MASALPLSPQPRSSPLLPTILGFAVLVACALGAAVVFLVALGIVQPGQVVGSWAAGHQLLAFAVKAERMSRIAVASGALLVGLFALALLLRQVTPRRVTAGLHMLAADDHGFVVVDSRGIATVAAQAAESAHGVVGADVHVQGTGTSPVRLRVDVGVYPGATIKRAGEEARTRAQEAVERLVGIDVRDVTVAVHVVEPDELSRLIQ